MSWLHDFMATFFSDSIKAKLVAFFDPLLDAAVVAVLRELVALAKAGTLPDPLKPFAALFVQLEPAIEKKLLELVQPTP